MISLSSLLQSDPQVKALMDQGMLAEDSLVGDVMLRAIFTGDQGGMIVDGFPRTSSQVLLCFFRNKKKWVVFWPCLYCVCVCVCVCVYVYVCVCVIMFQAKI